MHTSDTLKLAGCSNKKQSTTSTAYFVLVFDDFYMVASLPLLFLYARFFYAKFMFVGRL